MRPQAGSGGEQACADFFECLDDAGKALFMLGGPVDGRCPEENIDACAREFVRQAWIVRCSTLEEQAETPLVTDLTGSSKDGCRGTIDSFFRASSRTGCAPVQHDGLQGGCWPLGKNAHIPQTTYKRARARARIHASPNRQSVPLAVLSMGVDSMTRHTL